MALPTLTVHRIANRPNLFLGGDREMVMFAGVISAAFIFTLQSLYALVFGVVFWLLSIFFLRLMAKSDAQLRQVYMRHIRYQNYYPPHSSWGYVNSPAQESKYKSP